MDQYHLQSLNMRRTKYMLNIPAATVPAHSGDSVPAPGGDFVRSPLPLGLPASALPSECLRDADGAPLPLFPSDMGSAHFSINPRTRLGRGEPMGASRPLVAAQQPLSSVRSWEPQPLTVAAGPPRFDEPSSSALLATRSGFATSSRGLDAPVVESGFTGDGQPGGSGLPLDSQELSGGGRSFLSLLSAAIAFRSTDTAILVE